MISYKFVAKGDGWAYYEVYVNGILEETCDIGELPKTIASLEESL